MAPPPLACGIDVTTRSQLAETLGWLCVLVEVLYVLEGMLGVIVLNLFWVTGPFGKSDHMLRTPAIVEQGLLWISLM